MPVVSPDELMRLIDAQLTHVWVVRTFLKHSEESEEDPGVMVIVRELYDYCLAVGPALRGGDAVEYLKIAGKKFSKLKAATVDLEKLLPQISTHTNFKMALASLQVAGVEIGRLLELQKGAPTSAD